MLICNNSRSQGDLPSSGKQEEQLALNVLFVYSPKGFLAEACEACLMVYEDMACLMSISSFARIVIITSNDQGPFSLFCSASRDSLRQHCFERSEELRAGRFCCFCF